MQIQCPKCQSYNTQTDRSMVLALGAGATILGFLFSFLIFPLIFAAIGILLLLTAAFKKPKTARCKLCGYKWNLQA